MTCEDFLIVEDNELNQKIFKAFLKQKGYSFQVAGNGVEAVQKMKDCKFKVILMDLRMPVMDGIECTKFIRKRISKSVPVIGVSANSEAEMECITAGMNDFVSKPLSPQKVNYICDNWVLS